MFDMKVALNIHRIKCNYVIKDSLEAECTADVESAYADWCEAEGMVQMLTGACGKRLKEISEAANRLHHDAWAAWNDANNRVNYDPETGKPRRV